MFLSKERDEIAEVLVEVGEVFGDKSCDGSVAVSHVGQEGFEVAIVLSEQSGESGAQCLVSLFGDERREVDVFIVVDLDLG